MHDLVIRGGTIVDGSGAPAFTGDVAIDGEIITQVGGKAGPARQDIDADGLLVTPGVVDVHTHYDGQATWDPYLAPSGWHGVTTMVMGNCGVGFAPARPDRHEWLIQLMEGVEDIPGTALAEGIQWGWESFPEYLDALERMPRAVDVGTQVPHGAVRGYVMGERGARNQVATAEDIVAMSAIVEEALRAGALGFTSSRTMLHRAKDGKPVPGTFAGHDELIGIGRACARAGHGVFEIASDFGIGGMHGRFKEDVDWMHDLAKETGLPISFVLAQGSHNPEEWRAILRWTEAAVADGANLRVQVAARPAGMLLNFDNPMHPFKGHPTYLALQHLPFAERIARLSEPTVRAQLASERSTLMGSFDSFFVTHFDNMYPLGDPPDYEPTRERSVAAIAAREGRHPQEVLLDAMLADGGRDFIYYPIINYADASMEPLREMLQHPRALLSLSDGGAHCGVICDASAPSYLLTYWARDRTRGARLPLEFVVKLQTRDTALAYGLQDRGLLAPGMLADVNVIDFARLHLHAPEAVHDLPAAGRRLVQRVDGYRATLKRGQVTYRDGVVTGALPGRLVRGPQRA
ncbi:MAG: amidohydrolase family protein, partial [Gammaproteobacteria bacterium]|nr:amidohydrolase family protein [Gammaproteobacteria bacterium]